MLTLSIAVVDMAVAVALPPLKRSYFLEVNFMRCMANGTGMYSKNGGQMSPWVLLV